MAVPAPSNLAPRVIRFGVFEVDLRASELRKNGIRAKLEGQPFQILALLLARPGELVTREELKQKLWPTDTFVDFEHSINTAVKRLREALGDSAETPRFIETLPRRGYRFIYPIDGSSASAEVSLPSARWRLHAAAGLGLLAVLAALVASNVGGLRDRLLVGSVAGRVTSIAVLPLKNLSNDPEQDYFAEGMTEMLITELGKLSALQVKSHQSVIQYRDSNKSAPEIARELNVDALLEGTVSRSGNKLRITTNFILAEPEQHLLSEIYEDDLADIFSVQAKVARDVANRIQVKLTPQQQARLASSQPASPAANEAYLQGLYHQRKGTQAERLKAKELYDKAIQIDPSFALAYAQEAILFAHGGLASAGGSLDARALTRQLAAKALELDDSLAEAHAALAWSELTDWDWKGAESEFKRAIELNPSYPTARTWYAQFLGGQRRFTEAFDQAQAVLRLDPASPDHVLHAVIPYWEGGRIDEAMAHWQKIVDLEPNYHWAHNFLGRAYIKKGRYQEAIAELEKSLAIGGGNDAADLGVLAHAYAKAGRKEDALKIIRELEGRAAKRQRPMPYPLAIAYTGLGDKEKAFARLEMGYEQRGGALFAVNSEPLLEDLREDPRFQDLMRRIGLPLESISPPSASANKVSSK
jgi:TolB-like protein/DNA-binding winged helix-turn-helix (wHTH) protein/Flp pilus assembly protein TadD